MNIVNQIKRLFNKLLGFFPSALPTGIPAFESWSDSIINTYALPTQDKDSIRFGLASMIMHLGPQAAYRSKWYFVLSLRAGAAKQVAGACFQDIKARQIALQKAAAEHAQTEAAAASPDTVAASGR